MRVGNELYVKDAYEVPNVQVLPSTTSSAPQPESSSTVESSSTKKRKVHQVLVQKVRLLPLKRHHQPNNRQALPQQSNRQHRNNHLNHQVLVHKNRRNHLKVVLNQMKIKQHKEVGTEPFSSEIRRNFRKLIFDFWRISAYFRRSWFCSRRLSVFERGAKIQSDFVPRSFR